MGYVGNQQAEGFVQRPTKQDLTGATGTSLTLSHAVSKEEDIDLYINNVKQEPTTAYTVADTAVTLTGSVVATDDIYVVYNSLALQTVTPPDGSVTSAKLASGAVTSDKLAGLTSADMPTGCVLQVKSATKTDKQSTTSATPSDVTGLSVSITPTSTSSKILVITNINFGGALNVYGAFDILRGSSKITESTYPTGNQIAATIAVGGDNNNFDYKMMTASHTFLDSPATTASTTYKVQFSSTNTAAGPVAFTINAPNQTDNANYIVGGTSTITVMEIAG